jgi:YegS/Rv2252/BmrU family lipid kinase
MTAAHRPLQAKLIYNAMAGRQGESPQQLESILAEMQSRRILPEVYVVLPNSRVEDAVRSAIRRGIKLVVVAGGDGTVDTVAGAMLGSSATLGIIPTGTRNNVALSLDIPSDIAGAVALLREGHRRRIDIGFVRSSGGNRWFMEAATLGLLSDLYPAADDLQHGDLTQIGSLLSTLVSATASRVRMTLDGSRRLDTTAHVVLIANMPYLGPHFQVAPDVSFNDGRLDVFVYSEMGTMDLISHAVRSTGGAAVEDARIKHYRVKSVTIRSFPRMPVLADGALLGHGSVRAFLRPRALAVMAGPAMVPQPAAPALADGAVTSHG